MASALLVLGIGNLVASDDGLGVHAIRALTVEQSRPGGALPPGTELLDGGTAGLSLLPAVGEADALLIIDAVEVGAAPGTVHTLTGADLYTSLARLSVHQVGAADLLAAATLTGALPGRVVLVGAQPATLAAGVGLSPPVAAALPRILAIVRACCATLSAIRATSRWKESSCRDVMRLREAERGGSPRLGGPRGAG